jgi:hypothetical protein
MKDTLVTLKINSEVINKCNKILKCNINHFEILVLCTVKELNSVYKNESHELI